jgi:RNA polymerase sigma-70 factor (ECF subfamily)
VSSSDRHFDIPSLRKGEKKAFEEIYREFYGMIFHLCLQYLNDERISEELVQDTFMKLWEVRQGLGDNDNIRNFLYTITKNNCLNYLRNQKVILRHKDYVRYQEARFHYDSLSKLGNYLEYEELKEKIDTAIQKLPSEIQETFVYSRHKNLKYKEIAMAQEISVKTVEARISKALRILREALSDYLN